MNKVSKVRAAAKKAGYKLHYNNANDTYSLHGVKDIYGLTLNEAKAIVNG